MKKVKSFIIKLRDIKISPSILFEIEDIEQFLIEIENAEMPVYQFRDILYGFISDSQIASCLIKNNKEKIKVEKWNKRMVKLKNEHLKETNKP